MNNTGIIRREGGRRINGLPVEQKPVVSIITATFNCCATLEQTITSVITQTYPSREYIVIDGGSSDGTLEILGRFDDSIDYWISEPDKGIYDALNKGIELAHGEWIYILGSDDRIVDATLFAHIFSQRYDSKFIYGDVIYGDTGKTYGGEFTRRMLIEKNICQQGILYHADLFKKLGYFDLRYPLVADWVFNMKAIALGTTNPTHIDVIFAQYALNGASNRITDSAFAHDRFDLIRKYLGFSYYVLALSFRLRDQIVANFKKHVAGTLLKVFSKRQRR